jgi:tetratricopeptide (TPR) repeat protein
LVNDKAWVLNRIADLHEQRDELTQALALYTQAIELAPQHAIWYRNRAYAYIKADSGALARSDIKVAAQLQPNHPYLALRRGELAILDQDYERALAEYRTFVESLPKNEAGYYGLGLASLALGKSEQSYDYYEQALSLTTDWRAVEEAVSDVEDLLAQHPDLRGSESVLCLLHRRLEELKH